MGRLGAPGTVRASQPSRVLSAGVETTHFLKSTEDNSPPPPKITPRGRCNGPRRRQDGGDESGGGDIPQRGGARGELALKRSPYSSTGFTNIITIKGKFQARLQVPGDGRGGTQKRKQYALPGLFDTAEDAAIFLAATESSMRAACEGKLIAPPKQDKEHKLRTTKQPAAPQPQQPMATAYAMPLYYLCTCP